MTTASSRPAVVYDADSHIMEPLGFIREFLDPALRDKLPVPPVAKAGGRLAEFLRLAEAGAHPADQIAELARDPLNGPKGYQALGAFNAGERSQVLDIIDVQAQLVFSTFSAIPVMVSRDPDVIYGGLLAHNRALAAFCEQDKRMLPVGVVSLSDVDRAVECARTAIELGCKAILVPARPAGDKSPGHPDLDPFWRTLEEARVPWMVHIGFQAVQLRREYTNNGRPAPLDFVGSGEGVRGKDYPSVHHRVEEWMTALIFDGVLERFPRLMGGAIEFGADWVPSFLRRLDNAAAIWAKSEPQLRELKRRPSEQITAQVRFTPTNFEDTGELINESNDRLYCFSTDYPHQEGGRDPFGRFSASIAAHSEETKRRFFETNFAEMMGWAEVTA